MMNLKRREFLKASAAIAAASAAGGFSCIEIANATPVSPPVVDRLSVRVLVDGANNLFLRPGEANGAKIEPPPCAPDYRRTLHNQWGLSLYIESSAGNAQRTIMVDFGYTPEALINNMELVGADPKKVEAAFIGFCRRRRGRCRRLATVAYAAGTRAQRSRADGCRHVGEGAHRRPLRADRPQRPAQDRR